MSSDLHSVHADRLMEAEPDPVSATLVTLERRQPLRHDVSDELVELIHEYFRDGVCNVTVRFEGLSSDELFAEEGRLESATRKRREFRSATGGLLATVILEVQ